MEDEQMEDDFPVCMKIEPFAKMSQILIDPPDKETTLPVKFRRNVFEESPQTPRESDVAAHVAPGQVYSKPGRHMRAQPRASYGAMSPEERRQAELLDTAVARQQLLLRQQQETVAVAHRLQLEQQAKQLVNEACILAPASSSAVPRPTPSVSTPLMWSAVPPVSGGIYPSAPMQMPVYNRGYYNPVTVLANGGFTNASIPPPGAPGPYVMGHDELMQAVRRELNRMQQE